jgi:hypothetical protein
MQECFGKATRVRERPHVPLIGRKVLTPLADKCNIMCHGVGDTTYKLSVIAENKITISTQLLQNYC